MDTKKKGGRPSLTPTFLNVVNTTPEGQPVVLQAHATKPALAYHHRRRLAESGIRAEVIAPGKSKRIGKGTVTNPTEFYALVAVGQARKHKSLPILNWFVRIEREVVVC